MIGNILKSTLLEKEILQSVDHPFLASLDYVFQTDGKLYFIMKFVRGGDLQNLLRQAKKFDEDVVKFYSA